MGKFTIEIDLGNDAMSTPDDVATALESVATRLRCVGSFNEEITIRDINGNKVGAFRWSEES